MEAQPQHSEQANRYAEVVRGVNKVLVSGSQDQFDAVNAFLAACPEEDNGQLHITWWKFQCTVQLYVSHQTVTLHWRPVPSLCSHCCCIWHCLNRLFPAIC